MRRWLLALLLCASPAAAVDLLVPAQFATIQAAIDAASDGDTIIVAPGLYSENLDLSGKQITLRSAGGRDVTFIDGSSSGRVITATGSETVAGTLVEGFTILNGLADSGGGLLAQSPAGLTVRDCAFVNNSATVQGGGVHLQSPGFNTLIEGCSFTGNAAPNGGGMSISAAFACVRDCQFTNNIGNSPGGGRGAGMLINNFGTSTIDGCEFDGNFFQNGFGNGGRGAGIAVDHTSTRIINCEFRNHNAFSGGGTGGEGGGVWARTEPGQPPRELFMRNCLFEANTAGDNGGGMYLQGIRSDIAGCRFIGNSTANTTGGSGGGLNTFAEAGGRFDGLEFIGNTSAFGGGMSIGTFGVFTLTNSLFAGNNATLAQFGSGGGLRMFSATGTISNCSFVFNTSSSPIGGALDVTPQGSSRADNIIAWGNTPVQIQTSFNAPFDVSYSIVQSGFAGVGNSSADPMFADADGPDDNPSTFADNDYSLAPGSPAIDAGDNTRVPQDLADRDSDSNFSEPMPWDVEGSERFVDDPDTADAGVGSAPIVDIGAYELQVASPCPGDLADSTGFGPPDQQVDFGDFFALSFLAGPCGAGTTNEDCAGDLADTSGFGPPDQQVDFGDFFALSFAAGPCP